MTMQLIGTKTPIVTPEVFGLLFLRLRKQAMEHRINSIP